MSSSRPLVSPVCRTFVGGLSGIFCKKVRHYRRRSEGRIKALSGDVGPFSGSTHGLDARTSPTSPCEARCYTYIRRSSGKKVRHRPTSPDNTLEVLVSGLRLLVVNPRNPRQKVRHNPRHRYAATAAKRIHIIVTILPDPQTPMPHPAKPCPVSARAPPTSAWTTIPPIPHTALGLCRLPQNSV